MVAGTLSRYFAMRFIASVVGSFIGASALAAMIEYVELMRRGADWPNATAWLLAKISMYRVPPAHRANPAVHGAGGRCRVTIGVNALAARPHAVAFATVQQVPAADLPRREVFSCVHTKWLRQGKAIEHAH